MSDWTTSKLSDVIEIIGGGTPKRSENKYWNGDIPWLSVADFNNDFRYVNDSIEHITELGLQKSSTKLLDKDHLIISARGTVGCLAQLSVPMAFNQSCYGLNGKEGILDNGFLYYFLKNNISELKQKTHGAVFDTITRDTFEHIQISYPDLGTQKEIAKNLGNFDDKIQLNTQINQTLEQIAQALFKSWFVDFDPVRAKVQALSDGLSLEQAELAAMQAISGKTAEELTALSQTQPDRYAELAETAKAFPCEMVEVDGVEVPKGWELSTIGEEVETVGGTTPSTKEESFWNNGKIAWTTPKDLSSATSPVLINTERKITELGLKKISSGLLPIGTVLLSSRAPVGYLSLAQIPVAINQGYIAIKCNKSLNNYYMLQWCKENLEEIKGRASGTTFLEISKTTFRQIPIIVPDGNILSLFEKQCSSIYQSITVNTKENINLEKTRDLLLPRLLNGEM